MEQDWRDELGIFKKSYSFDLFHKLKKSISLFYTSKNLKTMVMPKEWCRILICFGLKAHISHFQSFNVVIRRFF